MADATPDHGAGGSPDAPRGLFDSLKAFSVTFVALVQTRLQLLSTDLEEERERLLSLLLFGFAAVFCLGVGVVLATVFVVVAFWEDNRLLALGTLAGLFLLAGFAAFALLVYRVKTKPRMFAASLSELSKDRQHLSSRS